MGYSLVPLEHLLINVMAEVSVAVLQGTHGYRSSTHGVLTGPGAAAVRSTLRGTHRVPQGSLRYFTPCASADLVPYVDLVLYVSRDDGMLPGVRAEVLT